MTANLQIRDGGFNVVLLEVVDLADLVQTQRCDLLELFGTPRRPEALLKKHQGLVKLVLRVKPHGTLKVVDPPQRHVSESRHGSESLTSIGNTQLTVGGTGILLDNLLNQPEARLGLTRPREANGALELGQYVELLEARVFVRPGKIQGPFLRR